MKRLYRKLVAWLQMREHFLLYCQYVVLAEYVWSGRAVALARSPTFRWFWVARAWERTLRVLVVLFDRDVERVVTRIVTPERADVLEAGFQEWLEVKHNALKFSKQLNAWASQKGARS